MRKLLLALILSTTAASTASAQMTCAERRAEREQARAERAERADSGERDERPRPRARRSEPNVERNIDVPDRSLVPQRDGEPHRPAIDRAIERGHPSPGLEPQRPRLERSRDGGDGGDSVAGWRRAERDQVRDRLGRSDGPSDRPRVLRPADRPRILRPADARPDRPAPPPRAVSHRRGDSQRWRSSWHRDHRYNWRDHRRRHRSLFRLGFYFDPFGWSYRRHHIGWRLWPSYYERSHWLNDPYMYRLPYAPYPYKWVRYWDDALLVDTWSGEVVDVVHDFFWT